MDGRATSYTATHSYFFRVPRQIGGLNSCKEPYDEHQDHEFHASRHGQTSDGWASNYWQEHCARPVTSFACPGTHLTMIRNFEHFTQLVQMIRGIFDVDRE